ncbi:hypothetical protein VTJ49DRAFT_6577 [Mycothermus thermophilus]|uniref:Centrosomin N-terminal motif 1 domain-containing protein n=1 Tax=Humicola insolens TaxID=85995 RepID=A0ABR3VIX1_HUMIN
MDSYTAANGLPGPQPIDTTQDHFRSSPSKPISPLLLERLQKLRQAENDRMSSRSSNDRLSSSSGSRHTRSPSPTSSNRPVSSGGMDPAKVKKGLGVKEMEQTLSTLHKQNFDLKLELYHRRERQTVLEERIETLERKVKERDQLHESLLKELEKRDKAVEEAIGMIFTLEKRVEQLLVERSIVRKIEAEEAAFSRITPAIATPSSKETLNQTASQGDAKTPIRMPSFVSDRSEKTENLRNVYLGALAGESSHTLSQLPDDTPDTARMGARISSPALSDLSESSFASIYGRGRTVDLAPRPGDSPWPWDGSRTPVLSDTPTRVKPATPSRQPRPTSPSTSAKYHINGILDHGPSPLQRLAMLDVTLPASNTPRPSTATKEKEHPSPRPATAQGQPKTKKEKREALERVLTQGHFTTPQALPPTPDTLSSTTLQHETPTKEQGPDNDRTETSAARPPRPDSRKSFSQAAQAASTTAFDSRKHLNNEESSSATPVGFESQPGHPAVDRARGGNDYDVSRPKSRARRASTASSVDPWLYESMKSESTDAPRPMSSVSQAHSKNGHISPDLFSSPTSNSGWAADAMFGTLGGTGYNRAGGKTPVLGSAALPPPDRRSNLVMDAMAAPPPPPITFPGRKTPILTSAAPPPPDRRSSLAAKTRSPVDVAPGKDGIPQSPRHIVTTPAQMRSPHRSSRARSNSTYVRPPSRHLTDMALKYDRPMTVPPKQVLQAPPTPSKQDAGSQPLPKQRHYPPTTSRPRSRGLNSLFRRSTGSADVPAPPATAPPTDSPFKPPPQPSTGGILMGIPSWVRRASLGDGDRASVTPPPIQRDRGNSRRDQEDEDADGGVALEPEAPVGPATPGSAGGGGVKLRSSSRKSWSGLSGGYVEGGGDNVGGGVLLNGGSGGGKRKWLGLGRMSSLRNRGGA